MKPSSLAIVCAIGGRRPLHAPRRWAPSGSQSFRSVLRELTLRLVQPMRRVTERGLGRHTDGVLFGAKAQHGAVCCRTDRRPAAASARLDPFEKLQRLGSQQQTAPKWSSGTALAETVCAAPLSSAPVGTAVSSHSRTLLYSTLFPSELRTPSVLSSIRPMVPPRTLRCIHSSAP